MFAMDKYTLQYLIDTEIFSTTNIAKNFEDAVVNKEIKMSRKVIENGWNIGSLLMQYKDIDFTFKKKPFNSYKITWLDEIMQTKYRNVHWNEYQLVFIKGNRLKIDSIEDLKKIDQSPMTAVTKTLNNFSVSNTVNKMKMSSGITTPVKKPIKLFVGRR
jgi:hypothetical protein